MMARYVISWTEELRYRMEVDADSEDEARDKFSSGQYDFDGAKNTDVHLQEGFDVWEVQ
jgi:hypothetical protein